MGEFRMPSLGADMDEGTIVQWLVAPGDTVERGQIVAVVDTAKAAIEIEAFEAGVIEEILVDPGVRVPVGTPLAKIAAAGADEAPSEARPQPSSREAPSAQGRPPERPRAAPPLRHLAHQLGVDLDDVTGTGPDGRVTHGDLVRAAGAPAPPIPAGGGGAGRLRATPRARRIAAERGIDLSRVVASTSSGVVVGEDVEASAAEATTAPVAEALTAPAVEAATAPAAATGEERETVPPAPGLADVAGDRKAAMRAAIATLMSRSNADIPHYYVTQTLDLGPAMSWLRSHNADRPPAKRLLPAALTLRATARAALAVPELNGHWVDGAYRPADRVDLGVAVATRGGGLVTPAIPDAGPLGVDELMARLADLVARARRGRLKRAEMAGATITVSNLGESGPDALHGVIFPPQVALVGVGGIVERPWAVDGMLTVRPTVTIVLAADHRASDGRTAASFLSTMSHALAHPEEL